MEFNLLSCYINFVYMRNDWLSLIIIIEDATIIIITIKTIIHNLASSHCWLTLLFVIEDWNSDIEALSLSIYTSINSKEIDQKKKPRKRLKIATKKTHSLFFAGDIHQRSAHIRYYHKQKFHDHHFHKKLSKNFDSKWEYDKNWVNNEVFHHKHRQFPKNLICKFSTMALDNTFTDIWRGLKNIFQWQYFNFVFFKSKKSG